MKERKVRQVDWRNENRMTSEEAGGMYQLKNGTWTCPQGIVVIKDGKTKKE